MLRLRYSAGMSILPLLSTSPWTNESLIIKIHLFGSIHRHIGILLANSRRELIEFCKVSRDTAGCMCYTTFMFLLDCLTTWHWMFQRIKSWQPGRIIQTRKERKNSGNHKHARMYDCWLLANNVLCSRLIKASERNAKRSVYVLYCTIFRKTQCPWHWIGFLQYNLYALQYTVSNNRREKNLREEWKRNNAQIIC